ncbi:MAG: hypothetical protein ABIT01_09745 [Thermoanaerobaculia bacterium]
MLKKKSVSPNLIIVFGNSQTTEQALSGAGTWDGDGDSPTSKLGAAKATIRQFVNDKQGAFNIGLSTFAHGVPNGISISGKHWLYEPLSVDFPSDAFKEPAGTVERWGDNGSGPCMSAACGADFISAAGATATGPFFASKGNGTAYLNLTNTTRVEIKLLTGKYGDAYVDGTLVALTLGGGTHSMVVRKTYQTKSGNVWSTAATPGASPNPVDVKYKPAATLIANGLFYTTGTDAGKEIGYLQDAVGTADLNVNANCSGWLFQSASNPLPLVKIPRDYKWGATCKPAQVSYPCMKRVLRPQAMLVSYNQTSGAYSTADYDNPGYAGAGSKYADGCDSTLLGAVTAGYDYTENQAILITQNGSQAPIKNLLTDIYKYVNDPSVDGFSRGKRTDDPSATCRTTGVVLIYDNFNGCQNDSCTYLTNQILKDFAAIKVPVYVIGLGAAAAAGGTPTGAGYCIAKNTGAVLPDGTVGFFPVTDSNGLYQALSDVSSFLTEATKDFASASISSVQAGGDQMAYLATFNATQNRSIWNGRINGYKLNFDGSITTGVKTVNDPNDPFNGAVISVPSNDQSVLIWNTGANLTATPGTGATSSAAILAPGGAMSHGTYADTSNDLISDITTNYYSGRKIVFSLPKSYASPVTTLPIARTASVPENRFDLTYSTTSAWWGDMKALLGPQTSVPAVRVPALTDADAGDSLRFVWGDRDPIVTALSLPGVPEANQKYLGLKMGDVFHSNPATVGAPGNFNYATYNLNGYLDFFKKYQFRRQVLYAGANDGLLHAFDIGAWKRTPSVCQAVSTGGLGDCYDLGTGAELFAYAPRAIMQIFKPLKDAVGPQDKKDEWTVDGAPSAADVYIDPTHTGTPTTGEREWQTVLVGGMREGSPFEGTSGSRSRGSYFCLNVTQPDETTVVNGKTLESFGTFAAPKCLNQAGDATCARDWPTVMWEISDTADADIAASGTPGFGYGDMGETWARPEIGRVRICASSCGTSSAVYADKYVAIFGGGFDRERLNRRGNWIYMVDVETGAVIMKANSSCGVAPASGSCTAFGSVPSEVSSLDYNADGYLDVLYFADTKGQLWRVDLTDLRFLSAAPATTFTNRIDFSAGKSKPFLVFQAPQAVTTQYYSVYFRPTAIFLSDTVSGVPTLGIAFGTGDRDDILGVVDTNSLTYSQRFYYVIDDRSFVTARTETDLYPIASPTDMTVPNATQVQKGWLLKLGATNGERVITDSLAAQGYIYFSTFVPKPAGSSADACSNPVKCGKADGNARFYTVYYSNGSAYPGATDRGNTVVNANFVTNPIFYVSGDKQGHVGYTTGSGSLNTQRTKGTSAAVKEWKEQ